MPYKIRKLPNKNCYTVYNRISHRVFSKCSSLKKAKKQLALLRAIQYNKKFVPNKTRNNRKGARETQKRV